MYNIQGTMYENCIISKVHISSNCAVNSHIVFSESLGIFVLSPNLSQLKHSNNNLITFLHLHFSHLADAFIQSDLQMRTIESIKLELELEGLYWPTKIQLRSTLQI